jgi:hypothetical protein
MWHEWDRGRQQSTTEPEARMSRIILSRGWSGGRQGGTSCLADIGVRRRKFDRLGLTVAVVRTGVVVLNNID